MRQLGGTFSAPGASKCDGQRVISRFLQTDGRRSILCRRQTIELAVLFSEISKIGLHAEPTRNPLDDLVRPIFSPMPIEILLEPSMQRAKFAVFDLARYLRMPVERG